MHEAPGQLRHNDHNCPGRSTYLGGLRRDDRLPPRGGEARPAAAAAEAQFTSGQRRRMEWPRCRWNACVSKDSRDWKEILTSVGHT